MGDRVDDLDDLLDNLIYIWWCHEPYWRSCKSMFEVTNDDGDGISGMRIIALQMVLGMDLRMHCNWNFYNFEEFRIHNKVSFWRS